MKRFTWGLTAVLVLVLAGIACKKNANTSTVPSDQTGTMAPSGEAQSFTGEIMDSACAAMGSHDMMLKKEGAKNAKECTLKCVDAGSKFVLYDSGSKMTYQLDDQSKPKDFAGQKVKVTGTYDSATKTIHVQNIEAA